MHNIPEHYYEEENHQEEMWEYCRCSSEEQFNQMLKNGYNFDCEKYCHECKTQSGKWGNL